MLVVVGDIGGVGGLPFWLWWWLAPLVEVVADHTGDGRTHWLW